MGRDKNEILAAVTEAKRYSRKHKASFNWDKLQGDTTAYFRKDGAADLEWRERFIPLLSGVMEEQGNNLAASFGLQFNVQNVQSLQWFDEYTFKFAQQINTTTLDGLSELYQQGQFEGWSIPMLQEHIGDMFGQWMDGEGTAADWEWYNQRMPAYRLETIARTESMRASNYGNHSLMDEWGVQKKEWLATSDNRTRDTHIQAMEEYSGANAIPIDQPYIVGGAHLDYPGDPSGPPEETINCRCTEIPSEQDVTNLGGEIGDIEGDEEAVAATGGVGYPANYVAPVASFRSDNQEQVVLKSGEQIFGRKISGDELVKLTGANHGETFTMEAFTGLNPKIVMKYAEGKTTDSGVESPIKYMSRTIELDADGNPFINNANFASLETGKGAGIDVFRSQIEAARESGIDHFETFAQGTFGAPSNGYYTWARFGYDAPLDNSYRAQLPETLQDARQIQDLIMTQEGREWWKENGHDWHGTFDLSDGSVSMQVLNDYLEQKGLKAGDQPEETKDEKKKEKDVEMPPELTAEDERILDEIWDNIGREQNKQ